LPAVAVDESQLQPVQDLLRQQIIKIAAGSALTPTQEKVWFESGTARIFDVGATK